MTGLRAGAAATFVMRNTVNLVSLFTHNIWYSCSRCQSW